MSTGYNFNNIKNKPMRSFAKEIGTTSNKMLDYLREKEVIDSFNVPNEGYEDWFEYENSGKYRHRHDLTEKGEENIRRMIKIDGVNAIKDRKVRRFNRKDYDANNFSYGDN